MSFFCSGLFLTCVLEIARSAGGKKVSHQHTTLMRLLGLPNIALNVDICFLHGFSSFIYCHYATIVKRRLELWAKTLDARASKTSIVDAFACFFLCPLRRTAVSTNSWLLRQCSRAAKNLIKTHKFYIFICLRSYYSTSLVGSFFLLSTDQQDRGAQM
jgi:hypothetical protein